MNTMQMIDTQGLEHQVQKGDWYKFKINEPQPHIRYFWITNITENFIEFRHFCDVSSPEEIGRYMMECQYILSKKIIKKKKIKQKGISGIMIENQMKFKSNHSTNDLIIFCADNKVDINFNNVRIVY